jgi:NTP pyrophosphatase (non-canonical NTP hydrolase)
MDKEKMMYYIRFVLSLFQCERKVKGMDWLEHGAMGLVTESAEVLDIVKKHLFYGRPLDPERLKDEFGDILFYWTALVEKSGLCADEIIQANIRKLTARYPEGYTDDRANNRDKNAEDKAIKGE